MSEVESGAVKVDRFSRLPPELLSTIFDYVEHRFYPILGPLSKSLLPYWLRHHYRTIRLETSSSLSNFFAIVQDPTIAVLVQKVTIDYDALDKSPNELVKELLSRLSSLRTLNLPTVPPLSKLLPQGHLCRLRHLSYHTAELRSEDLDVLSELASLKKLDLDLSGCKELASQSFATLVPQVEEVNINIDDEQTPWSASMGRFVDRFSNVRILNLHDDAHPAFSTFLLNLEHVTTSLVELSLGKLQDSTEDLGIACDHLLPRFSKLKRLALDDNTITASLPTYLRQLPRLNHLYLGRDTQFDGPELGEIISLIQGPNRIVSLKILVIDGVYGEEGKRVDVADAETEQKNMRYDGWIEPNWGSWDVAELHALLEAGKSNGVTVDGLILEVEGFREAMRLEQGNRLILEAYRTKSLKEYFKKQHDDNFRLPDINVERIDIRTAKLVKIDLPEEGWFQFTLE
ncbi:hypothetical protein JCM5350_001156 [Sporobolomyces pararoseus]